MFLSFLSLTHTPVRSLAFSPFLYLSVSRLRALSRTLPLYLSLSHTHIHSFVWQRRRCLSSTANCKRCSLHQRLQSSEAPAPTRAGALNQKLRELIYFYFCRLVAGASRPKLALATELRRKSRFVRLVSLSFSLSFSLSLSLSCRKSRFVRLAPAASPKNEKFVLLSEFGRDHVARGSAPPRAQ